MTAAARAAEVKVAAEVARVVLDAYDRNTLEIDADYLAQTLRMFLSAVQRAALESTPATGTGTAAP